LASAGVGLQPSEGAAVEVDGDPLVVIGLQVFNVYLAGDAFVAVLDRRGSLRHGDAAHPGAGHEVEGVWQGESAQGGDVFGEHLDVGAAEPQQPYLLGAGGGVAVVDIDRGVGGEALAQVAAGCFEQFGTAYLDGVGRNVEPPRASAGGDGYVVQVLCAERVGQHRAVGLGKSSQTDGKTGEET